MVEKICNKIPLRKPWATGVHPLGLSFKAISPSVDSTLLIAKSNFNEICTCLPWSTCLENKIFQWVSCGVHDILTQQCLRRRQVNRQWTIACHQHLTIILAVSLPTSPRSDSSKSVKQCMKRNTLCQWDCKNKKNCTKTDQKSSTSGADIEA